MFPKNLSMKKIYFTLFFICSVLTLFAQQTIQQSYHFFDYSIKQNGDYQILDLNNCFNSGEIGSPIIPWQPVSILLPEHTKATSISIEKSNPIVVNSSVILYPMQKNSPISVGNSGFFEKNIAVYQSATKYPINDLGHFSTQYLRGYGFAQTAFSPVEYIPSTGQITIYQDVIVTVTYINSNECKIIASNNKETIKAVTRLAQNSEMLSSYSYSQKSDNVYDILIITGSSFVNNFENLTNMYLKKGLLSEIISVTDIYSQMSGVDNQEKIRNYIIQEVNESQISHVILGGDIDVVPYRGFYCAVQSSSLYEDNGIPADLYFSALDGTWNDNNNNLWGEIGEDDLLPDLSVGRMCFSNASELEKMIHKSVSYQMTPVLGELTKVLLPGEFMYDNPLSWGGDHLDMLIGNINEHGYETNGIPITHNIYKLYDRDLPSSWTSTTLKNKMNEGYPFVDHAGHSNWNYVMRFINSDINNNNFSGLNGTDHNYAVLYSHGCICGAFDENDCIGELMTKIDNLAVAVFFNSRYGWFNEGQTEGPSLHINREFCDEMYSQNNTNLGTAHYLSKVATSPFVNAPGQWEEGALRWCFYDCNLLGDPVVQMWTDEAIIPTAQFNNQIIEGQTELDIQTLAGATVAFLIDDQLISSDIADATGFVQLSFSAIDPFIDANIWISGVNILPTAFSATFGGASPCLPPTNLTVSTNESSLSFSINWNSVSNASQYKLFRDDVLIQTTSNTNYIDAAIEINTEYCYIISTVCNQEESNLSSSVCNTYQYQCEPPTNLSATVNEQNITLSWSESLNGVEYTIYRNDEELTTTIATSYIDENLENGQYCYQIKTNCSYLESILTEEICATINLSSNEFSLKNFRIYPNPTSENFELFIPGFSKTLRLSIYDVLGNLIKNVDIVENNMIINVFDLIPGLYIVKIYDNQNIITKKLIIK